MTREEAIEGFRHSIAMSKLDLKVNKKNMSIEREIMVLDSIARNEMAIKALEQEPNEDCVDREELKKWLDMNFSFGGALRKIELFDRLDKELPPVTPTRKKGKWIYHEKSISTGFKDLRECSCCKCYFDWIMPRNSYCPNCGAEMESEE